MTLDPESAQPGTTPGTAEPASVEADWRRLHPLSPLLRGGIALIVIAGIVIANLRDRLIELFVADDFVGESGDVLDLIDYLAEEGLILLALLGVLLVIACIVFFSWLSWRFHTFRISGEAVEERSGILFRQHRRAPLERIQSVNLQRPLLARALGLTQVDVQTAGQGGKVGLRYLAHAQAKEVREQILRARARSTDRTDRSGSGIAASPAFVGTGTPADRAPSPAGQDPAAAAPAAAATETPGGIVHDLDRRAQDFVDFDIDAEALHSGSLVRVPVGRLIGSIALSWDLLVPIVMLLVSLVAGIVWQPYALGVAVPLVLVLGGIAFNQFNRGWGFTLSRSADAIRVGAGLTATNTETVPLSRIHAVEAQQPLLWRPFGWWKVRITTAGHSVAQGGQNRLQNLVLPVGREAETLDVLMTVLPGFGDGGAAGGAADLAEREALRDALVGAGSGFVGAGARAGWVLWLGRRRAGLQLVGGGIAVETETETETGSGSGTLTDTDVAAWASLRIRRGALTRSLSIMPLIRTQSLQLRRPLVHRALGLASVQAHTVLGPVRMEMRGLERGAAQDVFDAFAAAVVRVQGEDASRRAGGGSGSSAVGASVGNVPGTGNTPGADAGTPATGTAPVSEERT
ncbi:hypothetical protein LEUCIP111803_02376 [Leucobacter soli]|uniref:YdbS-like PH domain-containing protein n=2 Tax=Leucobacter soli TaxID=2812850 RepID=A0A916NIC9_9MICO|nr:PH domain-containing protein [Leucobacter soli]CAG7620594.1 hypothetical protein LEUCIP111803_02376 [Leucobacter soli]